jgi:hypothetical protein
MHALESAKFSTTETFSSQNPTVWPISVLQAEIIKNISFAGNGFNRHHCQQEADTAAYSRVLSQPTAFLAGVAGLLRLHPVQKAAAWPRPSCMAGPGFIEEQSQYAWVV